MPPKKIKKIVVLCDGTWCGKSTETETITNIKQLANDIAGRILSPSEEYRFTKDRDVVGRYFEGVGLAGSFFDYIVNGAMALDIKKACLEVYEYIVEEFESEAEIWMFGFSRGAYTVRCVAGMINNCGILRNNISNISVYRNEVYNIYRNKDDNFKPAIYKEKFLKKELSHKTNKPPIKFMGLLDTVGSLGIPKINPGQYLDYEEFYDQNVSGEVQNVYQALAIHDRLFAFEPCFIRRLKEDKDFSYNKDKDENNKDFIKYKTNEYWFPGAHYDIGRQRFMFTRDGVNPLENLANDIINHFGIVEIHPNRTYANYALKWMIIMINNYSNDFGLNPNSLPSTTEQENQRQRSWLHDRINKNIYKLKDTWLRVIDKYIYNITASKILQIPNFNDLKNDVYDELKKILDFIAIDPIGKIFVSIINQQALRDRYIPYQKADLTFKSEDFNNISEEVLKSTTLYPSETYNTYSILKNLKPDYTEWIINNSTTVNKETQTENSNSTTVNKETQPENSN